MLRYPGVGNRRKPFTLMILRELGEETVFLKPRESWNHAVKTIWHMPWMEQSHPQMCSGGGECRKESAFPLFTLRSCPCFHCWNPNRTMGKRAYKMQSIEVRLLECRAGHREWRMNLDGQVGRGIKITSTILCVYSTPTESILNFSSHPQTPNSTTKLTFGL